MKNIPVTLHFQANAKKPNMKKRTLSAARPTRRQQASAEKSNNLLIPNSIAQKCPPLHTTAFPRYFLKICTLPFSRTPETQVPSASRIFSNETFFQLSGQPLKYSVLPYVSCTISSIIAVTAAHIPSICITLQPLISENPGFWASWHEAWPGLVK